MNPAEREEKYAAIRKDYVKVVEDRNGVSGLINIICWCKGLPDAAT